ncbi:unnamed protein product [Alopecurus aequalis]
MDTEPFDEADLALPTSPAAASPPRRLKRLKKSSQTTTAPPAPSPPPPSSPPAPEEETLAPVLGSPAPPPPSSEEETVAPHPGSPIPPPPPNPSPPPPQAPADADAVAPAQSSPPAPVSSPLPPPDTAEDEEEDDGLDPLFSEYAGLAGWHPPSQPTGEDGDDDEEDLLGGGGLIEELRREKSAKKRLDMDEGEEGGGDMAAEPEAVVTGKRSKRRKKEDGVEGKKRKKEPKETAGSKKRAEKERRVQLESIHAESQRLLRETRKASFKPIAEPVYKPISSVLEKIRLRKQEMLKKSNTPVEEEEEEEEADDASSEPESDPAEKPCMPGVKEFVSDDKDLKNDDADNEVGANVNGLNDHDSPPEDEDALTPDKDLNNHGVKSPDKEPVDNTQDNHEDNAEPINDSNIDAVDETPLPHSSSPTKSTDDSSSEDEEDNDKENIYPDTQQNDVNTLRQPRRALAGDSCPDAAILRDFLDVEAEEEDDSDDDMMRFKDNEEEDGDDENEVLTALIAAGFEEEEVDHEKRNALHQKWLQQQDAAETNNVIQRLKYGHKEQKNLLDEDEDEDDVEDCEDESENEMSYDVTPNIVRQNSEKAKQMIAKLYTDENDTYEHSDDDEIEENLARQRIAKREVHNSTFISPLEDDSSREMFSLIKKLNIAPEPKRKGKQATSNLEMLMMGSNSNSSSKSSFLGRTTSGPISSSHRSVYKTYVFGRDDSNSNSKSCLAASESTSDMEKTNPSQPKKAKFSSSQQSKPAATGTTSEGGTSSGASLFELLRRSSEATNKQEPSHPESFGVITESQAVHQFSAFKLSRKFSKIGARN